MTDPFEALREPVTPVDPDPYFAEALLVRARAAFRRIYEGEEGSR